MKHCYGSQNVDRWGNTPMMDALSLGNTKILATLKREQLKRYVFT